MKKIISLLLVCVMFMAGAASAAAFDDIKEGEWYSDAVAYMVDGGYMNGVSDTEFAPDSGMTRAMFVTVLGRMDGVDPNKYTKKIFPDVSMETWYGPYVSWAFENGIASGFADLSFHPDEQISRAQLAVMIGRYIEYSKISIADNPSAYDAYSDEQAIPDWAAEGVSLMRRTGIITGDAYGGFMPLALATRAQIAAMIMRLRMAMNGSVLDIPQRIERSKSEMIMADMTLKEKVYQMFAATPEQLTGVDTATMAGNTTRDAVEKYPVGAIIYSGRNVVDAEQITNMLVTTNGYFKNAPFLAVSEEPGANAMLAGKLDGVSVYEDAYSYRNTSPDEISIMFASSSSAAKSSGFNMNLAAVADLWSNPANTFIAKRAFGNKYEECAPRAAAAVKAVKAAGMVSVMKYFPGYGSSANDPTNGECVSSMTIDDLRNYDFNSYKDCIDAGADAVICANVMMKAVDPYYPASLSTIFINDILRGELGFNGIVMSDSLSMKAISQKYTSADAAVRAVDAGCDIVMCPDDLEEAATAVIRAVESGSISENRINNSVMRILDKKIETGIISE